MGLAIITAVVILAIIAYIIIFLTGRTKANNGIVQAVNWQRSIAIEAIGPVTYETWKDQVPSDGVLGNCSQQERSVESAPAPNSTEVCGTPYTVDSGSGAGQVVQDCEYHVYDDYCQYTVKEWTKVDEVVAQGKDLNQVWPIPIYLLSNAWENKKKVIPSSSMPAAKPKPIRPMTRLYFHKPKSAASGF